MLDFASQQCFVGIAVSSERHGALAQRLYAEIGDGAYILMSMISMAAGCLPQQGTSMRHVQLNHAGHVPLTWDVLSLPQNFMLAGLHTTVTHKFQGLLAFHI